MNNYAKFLEECYFTVECKPYYLKGKESLNGMKKYYATDVGLRSNLSEVIEYDDSFALENIIYNELIFRGYIVKYGKFPEGEIDFVVQKANKKCLIQVAYTVSLQQAFEREYGAFNKVNDNSPKYVMTLDKKDTSHNGITHINIIDFLIGNTNISLS